MRATIRRSIRAATPALVLAFGLLLIAAPSSDAQIVAGEARISEGVGGFGGALEPGHDFSQGLCAVGDVDGDGVIDLAVGSPGEPHLAPFGGEGAVWILFMNTNGTVKAEQKIGPTDGGFTGTLQGRDQFGYALAPLGDLDGDTVPDLAVGAPGEDGTNPDNPFVGEGAVWILFLNSDGTVKSHTQIGEGQSGFPGALDEVIQGFGSSLALLDPSAGQPTLVVGVPGDLDGTAGTLQFQGPGAVWLLDLNSTGFVFDSTKISTLSGIAGLTLVDGDLFGSSLTSTDDLDGNGTVDLIVGSSGDDDGGTDTGAVRVIFLNASGSVQFVQKISATSGGLVNVPGDAQGFGAALAALPDLDGDGNDELAVGGTLALGDGQIWMLNLSFIGQVADETIITEGQEGFVGPLGQGANFGRSLASLGDLDGDGNADLAAGSRAELFVGEGEVWVLFLDYDATPSPWADLGFALAGTHGDPSLVGAGPLIAGQVFSVHLTNALEDVTAWLTLGFFNISASFKGGVLVPSPDILLPIPSGPAGEIFLQDLWPAGVPSGVAVYYQYWLPDPAAVKNFAASNGLSSTQP
jgi:hypothetical protein